MVHQTFNQPLNSWDVSKTNTHHIICYVSPHYAKGFNLPLNNWIFTSSVINNEIMIIIQVHAVKSTG